jgi:hypothetical protein
VSDTPLASLADCALNRPVKVARVIDQDAPFLQFVHRRGLTPGTTVRVEKRDDQADAVVVKRDGKDTLTLGTAAAAKILVEPL